MHLSLVDYYVNGSQQSTQVGNSFADMWLGIKGRVFGVSACA